MGGRHKLISPGGIGQAALGDGEAILIEVQAVDAPDGLDLPVEGLGEAGATVLLERGGKQGGVARHPLHLREVGDLALQPAVHGPAHEAVRAGGAPA